VSRSEFKEVFFGGKKIRLIDPLVSRPAEDSATSQKELLK